MYLSSGQLIFSPSDLITFMESEYASAMERLKLEDTAIAELMDSEDVVLASLQQKGYDHEDAFTQQLKNEGKDVLETKRASPEQTFDATLEAMKAGQEVITQGYLSLGQFGGFTDYLVKVDGASNFGDYHYEVWDTKLSKKLKPYFAIQLCCYIEMLEAIQGVRPKQMVIVLGDKTKAKLNVDNYFAYYRSLKSAFLAFHESPPTELPNPNISKNYGRWSDLAHKQLVELDHLSLVANISRSQVNSFEKAGIQTMQGLADSKLTTIPNMNKDVFQRAKAQAKLQIESRSKEKPDYIILSHEEGAQRGLAILPPHSANDVFFDIEGYPHIEGGLEYLWGNIYFDKNGAKHFKEFWAHDHSQEKKIFIEFIDWIYDLWIEDPTMHIYHYANYEIAAIRKLMGRYGVCEEKVDNLLRNKVFVDLYNVVRHGIMIGEPRYSIKNVEHIYRSARETDVASGGESIVVYENWRENPDGMTWETSDVLNSIRDYNIDDCDSTHELTQWLRNEQSENAISCILPESEGEKEIPEEVTAVTQLRDRLLNLSEETSDEKKSALLEILAWSLEFHRRENKPTWWRLFERLGWTEIELYDDMDCLAGLTRTSTKPYLPTPRSRNYIYEYNYDMDQPFKGSAKSYYVLGQDDMKLTCKDFDPSAGIISFSYKEELPKRLNILPDNYVRPDPIPAAIKSVIENLLKTDFAPCAILAFLTRSRPRIAGSDTGNIIKNDADLLPEIIQAATNLDNSYLCIQGPPGAGKTYTAKHIIGELLRQGKRVGISSNSHKAIINLMHGVAEYTQDESIDCDIVKAGGDKNDPIFDDDGVDYVQSVTQFTPQEACCLGGTAWAFSNDHVKDEFDYLFIDEAGQVSVANMIAMSQSCSNIILMGDQMQLGQPIQGSHPGESGMSILDYLLQGHATIPPDIGVFLPKTFRMHSDVCELISRQVYESKLSSDDSTQKHRVQTLGPLITRQSGICFVPVSHEGNTQGSPEEVAQIAAIAKELIGSTYWPTPDGTERKIGLKDILFVAPYNYQVNLLQAQLGDSAKVGSIDKFQGQEAPIVILSMCASDAEDSPRGIDFLFSKNRLNVAISRAQALAIVVGNPKLAQTNVKNLKQMEQINFFCDIVDNAI